MPWSPRDVMSLRQEFVLLARQPDANVRELCRRFAISPATAYKLLKRYAQQGQEGLADQSRRPQASPRRTPTAMEQAIVAVRQAHPAWAVARSGHGCGRTRCKTSRKRHKVALANPYL